MPSQPACFHRLDEILSALRSMTSNSPRPRGDSWQRNMCAPAAADVCARLLGDLSASQGQMEAQRPGVATMETALPYYFK